MAASICRITWKTDEQAERGRGGSPAARMYFDRCATATSGQDAVLVLAHLRHCVGKPKPGRDQDKYKDKGGEVDDHAVSVIVDIIAVLEFCKIVDRRGQTRTQACAGAPARKSQHAPAALGRRGLLRAHKISLAHSWRPFDVPTGGAKRWHLPAWKVACLTPSLATVPIRRYPSSACETSLSGRAEASRLHWSNERSHPDPAGHRAICGLCGRAASLAAAVISRSRQPVPDQLMRRGDQRRRHVRARRSQRLPMRCRLWDAMLRPRPSRAANARCRPPVRIGFHHPSNADRRCGRAFGRPAAADTAGAAGSLISREFNSNKRHSHAASRIGACRIIRRQK